MIMIYVNYNILYIILIHKGGINMSKVLNMRYPEELLKRIDEYKEKKGFTTRTQAIIHLIQKGLESK